MRKDLVIIPEDRPGELARIGEAAGEAGLNIEAFSAFTGGGKGIIHLLVDEDSRALEVFTSAGFEVKAARSVVVVDIDDQPGALGATCRALAEAGVNIEQAYLSAKSQLVIICDDNEGAKAALGLT
ncbi:MAG: ACT domain-containing protein [Nitriliruptorales bacterium]|nr:ACT domain-containing protein [Nitriliruptorales bacterium]